MSDIGSFPPRSDLRWNMVAIGRVSGPWTNLAMKMMMVRIAQAIENNKTEANIEKCGDQIFEFFQRNEKTAAQDLHVIFR